MFDAEYNDQVRSFVESVEPDFRYEGTDGLISMVIESAENVMTINAFIEAEDKKEEDKENFLVRGAKTVGGWIKTAFKKIYEFIKSCISKIKGLFLKLFHKIKAMYAAALEKIGGYLKEKINYDDNRATVTWYKLKAGAFDVLKQDIIGTTEEEIKDLAQGTYEDIRDKKMTAIEVPSMDDIKKNSKIFDYIQTERIKKSDFDSIFNGTIVKGLNTAYANVQKFNAEVLKAAHKAEADAEKADNKEDAKKAAQAATKAVGDVNRANVQYMNKCFSVAIFAFHQALKAVLVGLKGTAGIKVRQGRNWVAGKVAQGGAAANRGANWAADKIKKESFEIEEDRYKII